MNTRLFLTSYVTLLTELYQTSTRVQAQGKARMLAITHNHITMHVPGSLGFLQEKNGQVVVNEIIKVLSTTLSHVGMRYTIWFSKMRPWPYKSETYPLKKTKATQEKQWMLCIYAQELPEDTLRLLWWKSYHSVRNRPQSFSGRVSRVTRRTYIMTED